MRFHGRVVRFWSLFCPRVFSTPSSLRSGVASPRRKTTTTLWSSTRGLNVHKGYANARRQPVIRPSTGKFFFFSKSVVQHPHDNNKKKHDRTVRERRDFSAKFFTFFLHATPIYFPPRFFFFFLGGEGSKRRTYGRR